MENKYAEHIFLSKNAPPIPELVMSDSWLLHQERQFQFLLEKGMRPDTVVLDVGCGPLRLGSALIPYLADGFYFGSDINQKTLDYGVDILKHLGHAEKGNYKLHATANFDFCFVDRPVDISFSNSLFSHLTFNSIMICLRRMVELLQPGARYYSTMFLLPEDQPWHDSYMFERQLAYPTRDPYHYHFSDVEKIAAICGFSASYDPSFPHPVQKMICFEKV